MKSKIEAIREFSKSRRFKKILVCLIFCIIFIGYFCNFSKNTGNDPINMKVMQKILMLVRLSDQEDTEQHFRSLNDLEDSSKKKFQVSGMSFSNL